jgi:hypothetical protein
METNRANAESAAISLRRERLRRHKSALNRVSQSLFAIGLAVSLMVLAVGSSKRIDSIKNYNGDRGSQIPSPPTPRRFDDLARASQMPPQEDYSPGADPAPPLPFVEMGDPRSADCIVRDISSTIEGAGWRWTYLEPTLKFYLREYEEQRFGMDFSIPERQFADTGPVTLSCYINGQLLAKHYCPRPGNYHLEAPVPSSWIEGRNPTIVRAVLDKVWVAPSDGARLSYVLLRAGFTGKHE